MSNQFTPSTTTELVGYYGVTKPVKKFLCETLFSKIIQFPTESIMIDRTPLDRRMAGLLDNAQQQGELSAFPDNSSQLFFPAVIKVKDALIPSASMTRLPGEAIGGTMSPMERKIVLKVRALAKQDEQIARREEYMAAEALIKGYVTIKGEGTSNPLTVSCLRPSGNTINLSGTAQAWGQPNINPLDNLNAWANEVQAVSAACPNIVIMDPYAYTLFLRSTGFEQIMNAYNQPSGFADLAGVSAGGYGNEARYINKIGDFHVFVYQSYYKDNAGVEHSLMPPNTVIMAHTEASAGARYYGAIQDSEALTPLPRYPSNWYSYDNGMEYVQTQSAPVVMLGWAQSTFCATVA